MRQFFLNRRQKGFTIVELMVSLTVLTLLSLGAARVYLNYTASTRDLKAANLIYEEARFLMERMVREVRQNAIDYEQYANQNITIPLFGGDYTDHYCSYDRYFYDSGPDGDPFVEDGQESIGRHNPELEVFITSNTLPTVAVKPIETELYLININGDGRTMIKRIERLEDGENIGKLSMVKLIGKDFGEDHINRNDSHNDGGASHDLECDDTTLDTRENDGLIDTWHCDDDYPCIKNAPLNGDIYGVGCQGLGHTVDDDNGFVDISPSALNITGLKFIISPSDDPWKAYNMDEVQIQPNVTIQLTAEANPKLVSTTGDGRIPSITLTSTVTTRIYDEIKSSCF